MVEWPANLRILCAGYYESKKVKVKSLMATVSVIREAEHFTTDEIALQNLRTSIKGAVILREDPSFDGALGVCNAAFNGYPFMIVKCREVEDVLAALEFARDHKMAIAVVGGNHLASEFAACHDGLVIDLSPMKGTPVIRKGKTISLEGGAVLENR